MSHRPVTRESADTLVRTADDIRVSDRERDAVIDALRRHTGEGRLTLEEFEERTAETLAARTGAQLRTALRDLPPLRSRPTEVHRRGGAWHRLPYDVMWLVPALVVATVIAVFGGPTWPLWVFGPWLAFILLAWVPRGLTHH